MPQNGYAPANAGMNKSSHFNDHNRFKPFIFYWDVRISWLHFLQNFHLIPFPRLVLPIPLNFNLKTCFAFQMPSTLIKFELGYPACSASKNWYTSGPILRVLSYFKGNFSKFMCHHRIWTELSHACNSHLSASMDYIFILT